MTPLRIALACLLAASLPAGADSGDGTAAGKDKEAKPRAAPVSSKPKGKQDFVPGGIAQSFVIPKNTCESGTPLQNLLTDKPDKKK